MIVSRAKEELEEGELHALRDGEADEAGGAVPAISSSVMASCEASPAIVECVCLYVYPVLSRSVMVLLRS